MLSIYDFQHYREYLKQYYLSQKKQRTGLTYARFAAAAGLGSPNYLKLVIDGKKNLTSENIVRFSRALKLTDYEKDYFEALVQFNQSKKPLERNYFHDRVLRLKKRSETSSHQERTLEEFEFEAMSNWLHQAVLILTYVRGFREDPAWIKQRLFNLASENEIKLVLEQLMRTGLLVRSDEGKLKPSHKIIKTRPELKRLGVRLYYKSLLTRAIQSIELSASEEREFGSYLVSMSPRQLPELKRKVREFLSSLTEWALEESDPEQVYALSFFGFPISRGEERLKKNALL